MAPDRHPAIRRLYRSFLLIKALLILCLAVLIGITVLLAVSGIEAEPIIEPARQLSHQDIERIRHLFSQHDPRGLHRREDRSLTLTDRDLDLLLRYLLPDDRRIRSQAALRPDELEVRLTLELPENPLGAYLNIGSTLTAGDDRLHLKHLTLGSLVVPGWLIEPLLQQKHRLVLARSDDYRTLVESIQRIRFQPQRLVVDYRLDPELVARLRQRSKQYLFPEADARRMLVYHEELARIAERSGSTRVSLAGVFPLLFQLATARSAENGEPQAENRALLLSLTLHALGKDIRRFVDLPGEPSDIRLQLTLWNRHDLVQHYLVSAALAVSAGSGLAGAMGVFKELDDSRRGTGFSFPDLLADRAGIRLAEMATGRDQRAGLLQQRMAAPLTEPDFMPAIDALPEGIMELEFKYRYQDLDSRAYRLVEDEIERRLSSCRVYEPRGTRGEGVTGGDKTSGHGSVTASTVTT